MSPKRKNRPHYLQCGNIVTNGYLLTTEVVKMLEKAQVKSAQMTLDGIGAAHDATRHLRGGCPWHRLFRERMCISYRNAPEEYVRALIKKSEIRKK